ncbi:MAG TPA: prepilin-type N-terminal cleavage/methylation domain-containing protein [Planctomycetota bacterium]|nr:prepilin-type N-terminal cleavage/methylation domain-containing protein [Planctomycetota bacterium]
MKSGVNRTRRVDDGKLRGVRGFTLIEVAVSIVLLVVGLLTLAQVALTIRSMKRADDERELAANALLDQLHAIETTPFADLAATFNGRAFDVFQEGAAAPALRSLPGDVDGKPGAIAVVAPDPPKDPTRLLEATVRVDWVGSFGPQHLVRSLRISRPGANP